MFNDDGSCATCDANIYYDCVCVSLTKRTDHVFAIWREITREMPVNAGPHRRVELSNAYAPNTISRYAPNNYPLMYVD